MNELSRIQFQTTQDYSNYFSGRLIHRALEIKTPYRKWFPRVCAQNDYEEGVDFVTSDKIVRRADGVPRNSLVHPVTMKSSAYRTKFILVLCCFPSIVLFL